jgi:hypothetical protein
MGIVNSDAGCLCPATALTDADNPPTPTKVPPTATAANTSTPEPAATKEIKQYAVGRVGNCKDCVIPLEDLSDGSYLMWTPLTHRNAGSSLDIQQAHSFHRPAL